MKILYVHGYNGSAEGGSYRLLKKHLPENAEIFGIDYCQNDCAVALEQIRNAIKDRCIDVVVGSSLGGFLAILTEGIERYAVNPCYHPSIELPQLGSHNGLPAPTPEMVYTYTTFEPHLKQLDKADYSRIHVLIGNRDELLGDRYFSEMSEDMGHEPKMVFSSHHLSDSAAATICALIGKGRIMLDDAHRYATGNKELISRSSLCGCFSCGNIFPPEDIETWAVDKDASTAICPYCYIDAVLPGCCPYQINPTFLKEMSDRWF